MRNNRFLQKNYQIMWYVFCKYKYKLNPNKEENIMNNFLYIILKQRVDVVKR